MTHPPMDKTAPQQRLNWPKMSIVSGKAEKPLSIDSCPQTEVETGLVSSCLYRRTDYAMTVGS